MSTTTGTTKRGRKRKDDDDALPPEVADMRRNDLESQFVEQMRARFDQRVDLNADIAALSQQIKDAGFSVKVIKAVVSRQMENEDDAENRRMFEGQRDALLKKLGGFASTPLGEAAMAGTA